MTSSCPHDRSLPTRKHSPPFFKCMDSSFNPFTTWSVRSGYLIKRLQCWSVQLQDVCLPFFLCLNQTVDKHIYSCLGSTPLEVRKLFEKIPYIPEDKNQCYLDGWDLRRLTRFTARRQKDADRRSQVPRDPCISQGHFVYNVSPCYTIHHPLKKVLKDLFSSRLSVVFIIFWLCQM